MVFDMLGPIEKLIIAALIIDRVAKYSNMGVCEEKMRNVMDGLVTCSIPDTEFKFMIVASAILDCHHVGEVFNTRRWDEFLRLHGRTLDE